MDEEAKTKEPDKTQADVKSGDGDKPKEISELDRADSIVERQEKETTRRLEVITREEKLHAAKMVGGKSEGGSQPEAEKKLTDVEYAEKVLKGEANPLKDDGFI